MTTGHSARVVRRRRQVAVALVAAVVVLVSSLVVARSGGADGDDVTTAAALTEPEAEGPTDEPAAGGTDDDGDDPADDPADDGAAPVAPAPDPLAAAAADPGAAAQAPAPAPAAEAPSTPAADEATVLAGIVAPDVPDVGSGEIVAVAGSATAPAPAAKVVRVRVGVEGGLPVDGGAYASFVMATLNDGRSWAQDGYSFARTDGDADLEVVLASPRTSAAMCSPLVTNGTLSCRNGNRAIITHFRWVNGTDDYAADLTGYRQYVVNHEVGHYLGRGHVSCPAAGSPAPVMMQQTKGLGECTTNPWPHP